MLSAERKVGAATILQIEGTRLDAAMAPGFKDAIKAYIDRGERHIVIDLVNVQFMDSSGLGALVGALKYMGREGRIELANPGDAVMKVLRLTRMNKVFTILDSLPAA